jgi:Tol biopolymer transport system component
MRSIDEFDTKPVTTGAEQGQGVNQPAFSPDGRWLAYFVGTEGAVRRVPVTGGSSVRVCSIEAPLGITWDDSGLLIGQGARGVVRCPESGAAVERVVDVSEGEEAHGPQLLPDGKTLLLTVARTADGAGRWNRADIVVWPLPSGPRRTIIEGGSDARYLPTGHVVYALRGVLYAARFDVGRLALESEPVPVVEGVRRSTGVSGTAQFATAANGTLVYVAGPADPDNRNLSLATADRGGQVTPLTLSRGAYSSVRVGPDGKTLAITTDDGQGSIIWTHVLGSAAPLRRLTLEGRNAFPVWSPDGQRLAFQSDRKGGPGIYVQRVDGTGSAERLTTSGPHETHIPESWSPDGAHLAFSVVRDLHYALSIISLVDKRVAPIAGAESAEPLGAAFSPDGKWLVYASSPQGAGGQSPNRGIFLQPFPSNGEVSQAPKQLLDFHPVWSRDGKELIFVPSAASERMTVVPIVTRPTLSFGPVINVPQRVTGYRLSSEHRAYDVLPNGQFIGLAPTTTPGPISTELRIVLNWFEELKQRSASR